MERRRTSREAARVSSEFCTLWCFRPLSSCARLAALCTPRSPPGAPTPFCSSFFSVLPRAVVVDVRDVAMGHILAVSHSTAWSGWGQRFLLVGNGGTAPPWAAMVDAMRHSVDAKRGAALPTELAPPPAADAPPSAAGAQPPHATLMDITASCVTLGVAYHGVEAMVRENITSCVANSFSSTTQYAHKA